MLSIKRYKSVSDRQDLQEHLQDLREHLQDLQEHLQEHFKEVLMCFK